MKIRVYTDGACSGNPGPGGWAAIILFPDKLQEISGGEGYATNNRMELQAVIESIKFIFGNGEFTAHLKVDIHSDSAYVVNSIKNGWLREWYNNNWKTTRNEAVKNKDLWYKLKELLLHREINFIKIQGHSNNKYNEMCDKLAKKEVEKIIKDKR